MDRANSECIIAWSQTLFDADQLTWLNKQKQLIAEQADFFYSAFSLCSRFFDSKASITLPEAQVDEAQVGGPQVDEAPRTWPPRTWSASRLARACLCIDNNISWENFDKTFITADLNETLDLYGILPLYHPISSPSEEINPTKMAAVTARLSEGLRHNANSIFSVCSQHSPLPMLTLPEDPWNQMVLKALFLDIELKDIQGLRQRRNDKLDLIVLRYASERAHAERSVPCDLWDCLQEQSSETTQRYLTELRQHPKPEFLQLLQSKGLI